MNREVKRLIEIAKDEGWEVDYAHETAEFSKYSDYGQDFSFCIGTNDLIGNLDDYIDNFDISEETYKWLDDSGHGANGAPYDMLDVYKDMEQCKEMMDALLYEWRNRK